MTERLWRWFTACLPRAWAVRLRRWRIHSYFRPRIKQAKDDNQRGYLKDQQWEALQTLQEFYEDAFTQRLVRKARRYYVLPPPLPLSGSEEASEYWTSGSIDTSYLTRAGVAFVALKIEEAQTRRRAKWESWAKIPGGLVTGLVALGSVIVSLILALQRP